MEKHNRAGCEEPQQVEFGKSDSDAHSKAQNPSLAISPPFTWNTVYFAGAMLQFNGMKASSQALF